MQNRCQFLKSSFFFLLIFLQIGIHPASSQPIVQVNSDLQLIDSISSQHHQHSKREYIYKNQKKTFKNSNPISMLYGGLIYLYQNHITQHFSADCLYNPSCSEFSKQSVKEYGLIKGGFLTINRLNRCNRIAATDLDPSLMNKTTHRFNDPIANYK